MRRTSLLLAAACLTLPVVAAAAAQGKSFGGVVPDVPSGAGVPGAPIAHAAAGADVPGAPIAHAAAGAGVPGAPIARAANVPYGGGEVLHSNRTHVIFWQPTGSGLTFDAGYESLIETFLQDVAADSHKTTNVYGLSGQYTDARRAAVYDSTYGGAVVDSDPLPASGCVGPQTGPGWTACLSDVQLELELLHVVTADRLPTTRDDIYFLVLPIGLEDCEASGPAYCALGGGGEGSFCGYHSSTPNGEPLYAVIPYNAVAGHCQSDNPRPNSSTADPALSTISHEQLEMITDPLGNAWIEGDGNEIADLCIATFGPALGGSGAGLWNEVIAGGHYYLQEAWSNRNSACEPRAQPDSVSFTAAARAGRRRPVSFAARARDPEGTIASYDWFFGDGHVGRGPRVSQAFRRSGAYRVSCARPTAGETGRSTSG